MNTIVTLEYLKSQGFSKTFPERFWSRVNKDGPIPKHCPELGPCWEWTGWRMPGKQNYGSIGIWSRKSANVNNPSAHAHRASWILHFGFIPKGLCVLHKCDFCPCVNPDHLFLGTAKDNTHDMIQKGRMIVGNHAGEHNGRATVTWHIVRLIRSKYIPWRVKRKELAKEFGLSFNVVKEILNHRTWIED